MLMICQNDTKSVTAFFPKPDALLKSHCQTAEGINEIVTYLIN